MKANQGGQEVRRHADGSIDYGYYSGRAHALRDADFAQVLRKLGAVLAEFLARYAGRSGRANTNFTTASQAAHHS